MAISLIKPEDQEAMPSYVQCIQSSENHPVASWESVKKVNHQYSVPTIYQRVSRTSIFE